MERNFDNVNLGRKVADHNRNLDSYIRNHNHPLMFLFKVFLKLNVFFAEFKKRLVSRIHWGRGNYYKNFTHFVLVFTTVGILLLNISSRISSVTRDENNNLTSTGTTVGTSDLLEQGGNINTVLVQDQYTGLRIFTHEVEEGETLDDIAEQYNVTTNTIKEANYENYSALFLGDQIQPGWELKIPEINGFIHKVNAGETIDQIISRYAAGGNTEANAFNIIEFNGLSEPYTLEVDQQLFIPDGNKRVLEDDGEDVNINIEQLKGAFIDPLSHPSCSGYKESRGFTSYHNGVDLAKWDGCAISAVADGIVEYAGWASEGQGYMVRINHGGGIKTEYFHGNGVYYISAGEVVEQGDSIMHMGSTGYSTGTHLHFILWVNHIAIDPFPYVPYNSGW